MRIAKVVSGGQTGADRAALDWAARHGAPYGGWCPKGGLAEDLPEPPGLLASYPLLRETPSADPAQRTSWNVRDSDATLVVLPPGVRLDGGSAYTVREAVRLGRPHLVTHGEEAEVVRAWLATLPGTLTLNVAGPRESRAPGSYATCCRLLDALQ